MSANPLVKEIQASRNKIVQFKYSSESHEHRYFLFYYLIMLFTPEEDMAGHEGFFISLFGFSQTFGAIQKVRAHCAPPRTQAMF